MFPEFFHRMARCLAPALLFTVANASAQTLVQQGGAVRGHARNMRRPQSNREASRSATTSIALGRMASGDRVEAAPPQASLPAPSGRWNTAL